MEKEQRLAVLSHKNPDDMTDEELDFCIQEYRAKIGLLS